MKLEDLAERNRHEIESGIAEAEEELMRLRSRCAELERLIATWRGALGESPDTNNAERMTLHEALALILREHGNPWMHVKELTAEVNRRGLYSKRDGSPVEPNQVHARTKNYESMFEKDGPRVRLRSQ